MRKSWMMWVMCVGALGVAAEEPYVWPLELPRQLTSSFAEYRSGRFHAGIDLRTGEIGKAVYAADAGYVERVRSSPFGYGKAIYLRLDDGNTIVYGHLDSFEEPLAAYVRQAQHAAESYEVDLYPQRGQFPIARGQLIARSGNTGIGHPHLHYEIRDNAGRLINPRLLGITWTDKSPPTPRAVAVVPEGPGSWINGDLRPVVLPVRQTRPGAYVTDPIRVTGSAGVAVDVIDPAHGNRLGVWRIVTALNEQETFRIQHDLFSYDTTHHAAVSYHPYLARDGRFLVQWRWPGNEVDIYRQTRDSGWIAVPEGEHAITLRIADFYENEAVVTIPVIGQPFEALRPADINTDPGVVEFACWGPWLAVTAAFPASEAETPQLRINGELQSEGFQAIDSSTYRAAYRPGRGTREMVVEITHPRLEPVHRRFLVGLRGERGRRAGYDDLTIRTEPRSAYGALFIAVDEVELAGRIKEQPLSKAFQIGFADNPIDEPVSLSFRVPLEDVPADRVHMYRVRGSALSREAGKRDGDWITITTRRLGTFVALEDKAPPTIRNFKSTAEKPGGRRPRIEAVVKDALSGIKDIRLTYNDRWLLIRYDPEQDHIRWEQDHDLPAGRGDLKLAVTDHAGNVAESTLSLSID
jgi:hypothetical protein